MTGVILGGFLFIVKITLKTREVVLLFFLAPIQSLSKADIINRGHTNLRSPVFCCVCPDLILNGLFLNLN